MEGPLRDITGDYAREIKLPSNIGSILIRKWPFRLTLDSRCIKI